MALVGLAPFFGGCAEILVYLVLVHTIGRRNLSLLAGILVGALVAGWSATAGLSAGEWTAPDRVGYTLAVALAFAAITFCFWALINLNVTALRIRVLREIWLAPGHELPAADLESRYNVDAIFDVRVRRLADLGHLALDGGRVRLAKSTLVTIGKAINLIRSIVIPQSAATDRGKDGDDAR
jgi:hypothetical protein